MIQTLFYKFDLKFIEGAVCILHPCKQNTKCEVRTSDQFECKCRDGYEKIDEISCVDIDECQVGTHSCHQNANCTNTQPGYMFTIF